MDALTFLTQHDKLAQVAADIRSMQAQLTAKDEKIQQLESSIEKAGYKTEYTSEGVLELVKDDAATIPEGDYINPILYASGGTVEAGKWYTDNRDGGDIWEAKQDGTPADFADAEYFDIITV